MPRGMILGDEINNRRVFMHYYRFISILLMAVLLICPLFCAGDACCAVADCAVADCDRRECSHDEHEHEECSHQDDCPADHHSPCRNHQHPDCICQGAVVNPSSSLADSSDTIVVWFVPSAGIAGSAVALDSNPILSFSHPAHFPPLTSGRDICDLVSSWLL